MDKILQNYNESVADLSKLKKKVKKIRESQPVKQKKRNYEEEGDGWIRVTNKRQKKVVKRKKKTSDLKYYNFQVAEAKLKKHQELLAKFEEDKEKLKKMRQQRKFELK